MKLLSALPFLLIFPVATAQDAGTQMPTATDAPAESAEATSEFGEPVIVNGRQISDREIKRFLIYGVGSTVLETDRLAILVDQEMKHRTRQKEAELLAEMFPERALDSLDAEEKAKLDAGVEAALARFQLDEDYLAWIREKEVTSFQSRYPTLDLRTEISRAYQSFDLYELQVRLTLVFDACFFPGDPENWPEITKVAIHTGSPEVDLIADMEESWDRRAQQAEEAGDKYVRREDEMFFGLLRDYVIAFLGSAIEQRSAADGLDEEYVLSLQGGGWSALLETDEVYTRVKPYVSEQDVKIAKRWLAAMAATEDRLEQEGYLVPLEDHFAHLEQTQAELDESMFTMDFLAVTGHGFPSTQAFRTHLRAFESYRDKVQATLLPQENGDVSPVLIDYLPLANKVLGIARADVEVMLIGAFDQPTFKWKPDGWKWAKQEADRIRGMVDGHLDKLAQEEEARRQASENGENYAPPGGEELLPFDRYWAELLDHHSEFWDPPMPEGDVKMPPMQGMQQKGRFGNQPRNDLERSVNESSFYKILTGRSIADRVFHDMAAGDVGGPFRGAQGYYIVYVKSRSGPSSPIGHSSDRHRKLLEEEYVRQTFSEYVQQALESAETSGVPFV